MKGKFGLAAKLPLRPGKQPLMYTFRSTQLLLLGSPSTDQLSPVTSFPSSQVVRVHYPGLASHPEHSIALRQMSGFGGVVSFEVSCDVRRGQL